MKIKIPETLRAIFDNDEEKFLSLPHSNENLMYVDREGRSLLINAVLENLPKVVVFLAEKLPVLVQKPDKKGMTPLHYCGICNNVPLAQIILDFGGVLDCVDNFGNTPLSRSGFESKDGNYEMVTFLVQKGANPMVKNYYGVSPLDFATTIGDESLIQILTSTTP